MSIRSLSSFSIGILPESGGIASKNRISSYVSGRGIVSSLVDFLFEDFWEKSLDCDVSMYLEKFLKKGLSNCEIL